MRIGPLGGRRYCTNSGAPALLIKYPQTSDPCCPLFTGGKMCQILAQISTPVVFGLLYFWIYGALYRKTKTKLSRIDDRSTTTPNLGWVGPPTPRTVGAMGTPKGKSGNFLIYPAFQRPTPSTAPPMLYHMLGPYSCYKKTIVAYLSIRPLHFTGGQKSAAPSVNLGPIISRQLLEIES